MNKFYQTNAGENTRFTAKFVSLFLAATLLMVSTMGSLSPAYAAEPAQPNTPKQEVIYVNLNADGSVSEMNVVNIFDLKEDTHVIDYGDYSSVTNMTSTATIESADGEVQIDAAAGKLYYQGRLENHAMPWNITLRYMLDGKSITADELAGKSGALKVCMLVRQNPACDRTFFDNYALQASFTLDTDSTENIVADGATQANVGANKQLTYTILSGKETDIAFTADVIGFEMAAVAINGVRLNMDIEVDDAELKDKVSEITDATKELDDGAHDLSDGASKLYDATGTLNDRVGDLTTGVADLQDGAATLHDGLATLSGKSGELTSGAWTAYEGLCTAAQTALNTQLTANGLAAVTLTPDNYASVLMDVLQQMNADAVYQKAYDAALQQVTAQVESGADQLYKGYIDSQADSVYLAYMNGLPDEQKQAIYRQYVDSQADTICLAYLNALPDEQKQPIYQQAAAQILLAQLVEQGQTAEQAQQYLATEEGQTLLAQTVGAMTEEQRQAALAAAVQALPAEQKEEILQGAAAQLTDEQKTQILQGAVLQLTEEQKQEILAGALAGLTEDQKAQIRSNYIAQLMAGEDVTGKISEAVAAVNGAAGSVSALKAQLDSFGVFYNGVVEYTDAVGSAADGAGTLLSGVNTLSDGTTELKDAAKELHTAVGELYDGTNELTDGTGEFKDKTDGMDTQVDDQIDSMISSISGSDGAVVSFISDKNTNVQAVQFIIKTQAIEIPEVEAEAPPAEQPLSLMQKILKLFGM